MSRANTVETAWTDPNDEILLDLYNVVRKAIVAGAEGVDDDGWTRSLFTAELQESFKSVHDLDRVQILFLQSMLSVNCNWPLTHLVKRLDFFRERHVFDSCTKMFQTLHRLSLYLQMTGFEGFQEFQSCLDGLRLVIQGVHDLESLELRRSLLENEVDLRRLPCPRTSTARRPS